MLFSYLIRPSSLSPKPSPLIDERKLFHSQQRQFEREEPTGADNSELAHADTTTKTLPGGRIVKDGNNRVCNEACNIRKGLWCIFTQQRSCSAYASAVWSCHLFLANRIIRYIEIIIWQFSYHTPYQPETPRCLGLIWSMIWKLPYHNLHLSYIFLSDKVAYLIL